MFELLLLTALIIDCFLGDPKWFPHPVRIIGWFCVFFETLFRKSIKSERIAGIFTSFTILIFTTSGTMLFLYALGLLSEILQIFASVFIIYTFIAIKDLLHHSNKVHDNLFPDENIAEARIAVSRIVGRDVSNLSRKEICRACVETVAENMVDGITAPLFWAVAFSFLAQFFPINPIVFAAVGISFYKATNTMDSMFGYTNEKYKEFGWFSARFDDLMNLIPARLSGICVIIGAFFLGYDWRKGSIIFFRDRLNHNSPNAAHTEAAVAGVLGIMLGGQSVYFGEILNKPSIGDCSTQITPHHILKTNIIIIVASIVFLAVILIIRKSILLLF